MATLLGDFFGKRRPGFAGRLMVDQVRGVTRVRAWPKKRGKPKSALQQHWVDWFRAANFAAKYAAAYDIARAIEMSKGSGRYPRDILLMAMRGRLLWWTVEGEGKWFPVAAISDISDTLDVLAQEVGNILVRHADRWRALADKDEGDVLTNHPGLLPTWEAPAAGGGGEFAGALATLTGTFIVSRLISTTVNWQLEHHDTDDFLDLGSSASRFTIPAGFSWCRLTAGLQWATPGVNMRAMWFIKNGLVTPGAGGSSINVTPFFRTMHLSSAVIPCVEGDYFECRVWHNHNSALSLQSPDETTFFSIQAFP